MISPTLQRIFERVRDGADFMPSWQLEVHMLIMLYYSDFLFMLVPVWACFAVYYITEIISMSNRGAKRIYFLSIISGF